MKDEEKAKIRAEIIMSLKKGYKPKVTMTAVTEILDHCKKLISEGHQIDTQGLVHWIEDTLLEIEKQQIIDAHENGFVCPIIDYGLDYYNKTFKSE